MQLSSRSNDCWSAHLFLPWMVCYNCISSNKSCKTVNPFHWSQPFCHTTTSSRPQGETHGVLDTSFLNSSERDTTAIALPITNGVLFLPKGLWPLIRLTSFPNTCFSTCLVMSFAVQLVSDFVSTPYVLRQRHAWDQNNFPTCDLSDNDDEQHVIFYCANIVPCFHQVI